MKFVLVLFFVSLAFSEEISLFDAIKLLRERNYDFKISLYEIKKSQGAYLQAGLLQNPTLSVNYTGLNFGEHILYDTGNTMFSARIDQPIELGGKREYRKLSAMYQLKSVSYQSEDLLRTLSLGLVSAYFQALSDRAYLEYIKQDINEFEKMLQIQEQKQKLGFLSLIDLIKLRLYKTELENSYVQAVGNYEKDIKELSFYIGGSRYEPLDIKQDPDQLNLEDLIKRALEERESLKALKEQLKSADYQIKLLRAYSIPDISVGVEYDAFGVKYKPGLGFGFSINLPLFDRRQGDLITAVAQREQILLSIKREEERIKKELAQAYDNYVANKKIYTNYKEKKQVMDELLERTKKAYMLGGISTLDFLDTLRTYRAFMNTFLQARYQYLQSYYTLKILGGWKL
jgi:cobalt-zinc-cadmium efflux system outer membrane protein